MITPGALALLLSACGLFGGEPIPPDCEARGAWYPDTDADGIGDADRMYVGCEGPEGWTQTPPYPPETDDTDAVETDDTEVEETDTEVGETDTDTDTDGAP